MNSDEKPPVHNINVIKSRLTRGFSAFKKCNVINNGRVSDRNTLIIKNSEGRLISNGYELKQQEEKITKNKVF